MTCTNPHLDGCPSCVENGEIPKHTERVPGGCVGEYECTDCGHTWQTAWGCS